MNHYSKEELDQYYHKDINFLTRQKIKKHLPKCSECSSVFEGLKDDDELLDDIRETCRENISDTGFEQQTYTQLISILGKQQKGSSIA
jgi:hypothetical protein